MKTHAKTKSRKYGKQTDASSVVREKEVVYKTGESMFRSLTAIIEREDKMYVSLCPELDIASQGNSIEEAKSNLAEAIELFFETASKSEIKTRLHQEIFITSLNVKVG